MIPPLLFYHTLLKKAKQSITWIKIVIGSLIKKYPNSGKEEYRSYGKYIFVSQLNDFFFFFCYNTTSKIEDRYRSKYGFKK